MKVIGLTQESSWGNTYICVVSHDELAKCADQVYPNKLPKLKVGDTFDIGAGYNFRSDISSVCDRMKNSMEAFKSAQDTMLKFANMVSANKEHNVENTAG